MAKIVIEVSGVHGVRHEYHSYDLSVIRIGRGYGNDLILTDPYVSKNHVALFVNDDQWLVEDLSSENGTFLNDHIFVELQRPIKSGDCLVIGETRLRIFSQQHSIKPTERLQHFNKLFRQISHPLFAWAALMLLLLFDSVESFLSNWEKFSAEKLLAEAIGSMLVVLVWAGVWAFIGRLIKHRAYYSVQIVITSVVLMAAVTVFNCASYLGFYANSGELDALILVISGSILSVILLSSNMSVATNLSRKKRIVGASIFTSLILAIMILSYYARLSEFSPVPDYYAKLKPPFIKISSKITVDQFIKRSESVFIVKE